MRKLLIVALFVNAALLASRFWQELSVVAEAGKGGTVGLETRVAALESSMTAVEANIAALQAQPSLGDLACAAGEIPKWNGSQWVCSPDEIGDGLTEEQEEILGHMSVVQIPTDDAGGTAKTIRFTGVNVQVVNGLGTTTGDPNQDAWNSLQEPTANSLGNLIVGYNDPRNVGLVNERGPDNRTGSHNIILGLGNNYSSVGGLLAGWMNEISGSLSSVIAGHRNRATGLAASVTGGVLSIASGSGSTVSGGNGNTASGCDSSISGGANNVASGQIASVSGGQFNQASGSSASVSGGGNNIASNNVAAVSGGESNEASGLVSSVSGGRLNTASGGRSTVSGGQGLTATDVGQHLP